MEAFIIDLLNSPLFWLCLALVFFILEIILPSFFIACFGVGALCATSTSFLFPYWFNVLAFCAGSILSLIYIRTLVLKKTNKNRVETGMDALIGKRVVVFEHIDNVNGGLVKINGDIWRACSEDNSTIEEGEMVEVLSYESLILKVRKI